MQKSVLGIILLCMTAAGPIWGQAPAAGKQIFDSRCARCHGPEGGGGELGPSIVRGIATRSNQDLSTFLTSGLPGRGMPAFPLDTEEMTPLVAFLRTLAPPRGRGGPPEVRKTITTTDGRTIEGVVINENSLELQLRTDDNHVALLRPSGDRFRAVTSETGLDHLSWR